MIYLYASVCKLLWLGCIYLYQVMLIRPLYRQAILLPQDVALDRLGGTVTQGPGWVEETQTQCVPGFSGRVNRTFSLYQCRTWTAVAILMLVAINFRLVIYVIWTVWTGRIQQYITRTNPNGTTRHGLCRVRTHSNDNTWAPKIVVIVAEVRIVVTVMIIVLVVLVESFSGSNDLQWPTIMIHNSHSLCVCVCVNCY